MVESDHGIATLLVAVHRGAVDHDDVELAVIVAVNKTDSSAHGFDDVALFGGREVGHSEPGLLCNVLKTRHRRGRWRGLCQTREREESAQEQRKEQLTHA